MKKAVGIQKMKEQAGKYSDLVGNILDTVAEALKEEDLPFLCESAAADACAPGNPREASIADFEAMFRKLM